MPLLLLLSSILSLLCANLDLPSCILSLLSFVLILGAIVLDLLVQF